MKKKLLALFCVITCALSLAACGGAREYTDFEKDKMNNCEMLSQVALAVVTSIDSDTAQILFDQYNKEEMAALFSSALYSYGVEAEVEKGAFDGLLTTYNQMVSDMGGVKETGNPTSEISGKNILVTIAMFGENGTDGQVVFKFTNDIFTRLVEGDAVANTSFAQKMHEAGSHMGTAGLNTLLGMGSVFLVLILISGLIACFAFIKPGSKKEEVKKTVEPETVVLEEEEVSDDTELVAVIMAAISAFESANGGSADGFVVRSIKKANRRI